MSILQSNHISNSLIEKLTGIVEENLQNEQFGVEELAEKVGISRSHLHRKLQEATGQSISQFIREYRLQSAMDLLQSKDITASEVAYQVGFGSATYFSKSFTDFYGYPPGEAKNHSFDEGEKTLNDKIKPNRNHIILIVISVFLVIGISIILYLSVNNHAPLKSDAIDKSIAVLPFKNLSSDADNQYFADGIRDAILNSLSKIGQLRVISRTSVEQYRITTKTIPEIAKELGVSYILEGSAQKYGEEIRITTQLINAETDDQIWSQDYTQTFEDVLNLQTEIAENIAIELEVALNIKEKKELRTLPTIFPEAYDFYMLANFQLLKSSKESLNKAIPFFEKAIEIDPNYVEAYTGLANVWNIGGLVWGIYGESEAWTKAKPLLYKALELDSTNVIATSYLAGGYLCYEWDFDKASELFLRSKKNEHNSVDLIDLAIKMRNLEDAEKMSNVLLAQEPSNSIHYVFNAEVSYFSNKINKATTTLDEASELFDELWFLREAAKLYYAMGEIKKSKVMLEKHKYKYPDRNPIIIWLDAVHQFHDNGDSQIYIKELTKMYNDNSSGSPAWFIAMYYAVTDDDIATFEWLEKSYERHEVEMTWLKMEPLLSPYNKDPRY
ncbi:MAG: helix-turn-helix domain-containing protein, partial [Cyclobacteriaceae bacterium]|nr:helix-turn-helix domain-containing protein [Cyclobacteriaceae bacterium]